MIVWPDLDEPGQSYAANVTRLCLEASATGVLVIDPRRLPRGDELPESGDAVDWRALYRASDPAELRRILEAEAVASAAVMNLCNCIDSLRFSARGGLD